MDGVEIKVLKILLNWSREYVVNEIEKDMWTPTSVSQNCRELEYLSTDKTYAFLSTEHDLGRDLKYVVFGIEVDR